MDQAMKEKMGARLREMLIAYWQAAEDHEDAVAFQASDLESCINDFLMYQCAARSII